MTDSLRYFVWALQNRRLIENLTNKTNELSSKEPNSQPDDHRVAKYEPNLAKIETEITDL